MPMAWVDMADLRWDKLSRTVQGPNARKIRASSGLAVVISRSRAGEVTCADRGAADSLRTDYRPGTGPSGGAAVAVRHAFGAIRAAKDALNNAAHEQTRAVARHRAEAHSAQYPTPTMADSLAGRGSGDLDRQQLTALPAVLDVPTAARALGLSRTAAYELIRTGEWPTPVFRLGRLIRIPTAPILELLGIDTVVERNKIEKEPGPTDAGPEERRMKGHTFSDAPVDRCTTSRATASTAPRCTAPGTTPTTCPRMRAGAEGRPARVASGPRRRPGRR